MPSIHSGNTFSDHFPSEQAAEKVASQFSFTFSLKPASHDAVICKYIFIVAIEIKNTFRLITIQVTIDIMEK